jgi:hypothetical protein
MMRPVYLVDFAVYKPPEELRVDRFKAEEQAKHWPVSVPLPWLPPKLHSSMLVWTLLQCAVDQPACSIECTTSPLHGGAGAE